MRFLHDRPILRAEAAEGGEGGAPPVDNTAALAALQAQIDALRTEGVAKDAQIAEKDNTARYWHEEAKKKTPAAKADTPIETPDDEDPIEVLSKEGMKGFDRLAAKRGLVSEATVESKIEHRARQLTDEAALVKEFPEMLDEKSAFFKATATHYNALVAAGVPKNVATRQAANNAYIDGVKAGTIVSKSDAEEREARAAAAGGDKSRGNAPAVDPKDEELDAFQKNICEQMGVSEKDYKARAAKGVVYTGGSKF